MTKAKKMQQASAKQFTSQTLWTARAGSGGKTYTATKAMQEQFQKSLAETENALKKKLESFETIEISDSAARALVK